VPAGASFTELERLPTYKKKFLATAYFGKAPFQVYKSATPIHVSFGSFALQELSKVCSKSSFF
jgi:hypothetical protein